MISVASCAFLHEIYASTSNIQKINSSVADNVPTQMDIINEFKQFDKEFETLFQHNIQAFNQLTAKLNHYSVNSILKEEPKQFIFSINLPDVNPKDIHISLKNRLLSIAATKQSQSFYYRFLLPDTANTDKITAETKHGKLTMIIPKLKETPSRKITLHEIT